MKTFHLSLMTIVSLASLTTSGVSFAGDVVVIVNPNSSISQMSEDQAKRLFLGKTRSFPDGAPALVVDQTEGSSDRAQFYNHFIGKTESQLKSYWAQLIFSGKGTPPKTVGDASDVRAIVAKNPSAIGYIERKLVDGSVKTVALTR